MGSPRSLISVKMTTNLKLQESWFWSLDPELGLNIEEKLKRVKLIFKPKALQIIQSKTKNKFEGKKMEKKK